MIENVHRATRAEVWSGINCCLFLSLFSFRGSFLLAQATCRGANPADRP